MKAVFRALACLFLLVLCTGCTAPAAGGKNGRTVFTDRAIHLTGTLDYGGEKYYAVADKTENGEFSLNLSGEGTLAGFGFRHDTEGWSLLCENREHRLDIQTENSLAGTFLTFVSLSEADFISERSEDTMTLAEYSSEGKLFTLTFDKEGSLCKMETNGIVFVPDKK